MITTESPLLAKRVAAIRPERSLPITNKSQKLSDMHVTSNKPSTLETSQKGPDARRLREHDRGVLGEYVEGGIERATQQMGLFQRFHALKFVSVPVAQDNHSGEIPDLVCKIFGILFDLREGVVMHGDHNIGLDVFNGLAASPRPHVKKAPMGR